jgi:hypothetical protein
MIHTTEIVHSKAELDSKFLQGDDYGHKSRTFRYSSMSQM